MPNILAAENKARSQLCRNSHQIYVFSFEEMDKYITRAKRAHTSPTLLADWDRLKARYIKPTWEPTHEKFEMAAIYAAAPSNLWKLERLLSELGWGKARAYIKTYRGVAHIILKGMIGDRKEFTAARYGLKNAKVLHMRLGKSGAMQELESGDMLTIWLITAYRIGDLVLGDATLVQTTGRLTTDVVKAKIVTQVAKKAVTTFFAEDSGVMLGASAVAEESAGLAAAAAGLTVAIGPLVAVLLVGFVVTEGLEYLDRKFHLTKRLVAGLHELSTKGMAELKAEKQELMRDGKRLANGVDGVIDYASDKVEPMLVHSWHNLKEWTHPVQYLSHLL